MPPIPPALRARLDEALPGARLDAAEEIGRGWSAIAYRVPDRDDRGGDWVLRIPHGDSFEQVTGDIEREVRLLPVLEAAGLPTPREARGLYSDGGELLAALHRLVHQRPESRATACRLAAIFRSFAARDPRQPSAQTLGLSQLAQRREGPQENLLH